MATAGLRSLLLLAVISSVSCLYFHIGETEKKCFIEEIPDETIVVGKKCYMSRINDPSVQLRICDVSAVSCQAGSDADPERILLYTLSGRSL